MVKKLGRVIIVLGLVVVFILIAWQWDSKKQSAYDKSNLIRFHVIANSDSPLDQALKYRVRDEVIRVMSPFFKGVDDINTARLVVGSHADDISAAAEKVIREAGYNYPVTVCMGNYQFPVKTYRLDDRENGGPAREITLPAGEYEAVRVIIGSGRGANWWCVLFPPLCFVSRTDADVAAGDTGYPQSGGAGSQFESSKDTPRVDKNAAPTLENGGINTGKEAVLTATAPIQAPAGAEASGAETFCAGTSRSPSVEIMDREQPRIEYRFKVVEWFKISRNWLEEFM